MKQKNYKQTLLACYLGLIVQAIAANFLPLLYVTFHKEYNIGFGKLALLSTVFFLTQLVVDFICAKIVDKIGYRPCIITAQIASAIGIAGLSFIPDIMPSAFAGIVMCVFIYAIGSGLIEVLCSPIIEACPFENKESAMSLLHSFYCWGFAGVIILSTIFFSIFGIGSWKILAIIWAIVPIYNTYNFIKCPIEPLVEDGNSMTMGQLLKTKVFWIFILLMVGAGASEISLAQWASAFAESALNVSKATGDLVGPCGFAILMGLSRALYGKFGEKLNLTIFMALSGVMCLGCYLVAGLTKAPIVGLIACALCGFSVGIMWPGSISISSSILKRGGTALFAFLALAGDLGGSVGPFVVGSVSQRLGDKLQAGVLASVVFPILLVISVALLHNKYKTSK